MTTPHPGPKCGARKRQGPGVCGQAAGWGTSHPGHGPCKLHGGSTWAHTVRAERERLVEEMRTLGVPEHVPPVEGLLDELAKTRGELSYLRETVIAKGERDPESLFRGTKLVRRKDDGSGNVETTTEVAPGLSVEMQTYRDWKRLYLDQVAVAVARGVKERQIELMERAAVLQAQIVVAALDAAGVTGDARIAGLTAARSQFAVMSGLIS